MAGSISRKRWYVKKAARKLAAAGSYPFIMGLSLKNAVRVVTYHRFGNTPFDPFCILSEMFDAHMRWIAENNLAASQNDIENHVQGKKILPRNAVCVTIDDGYKSLYTHAYPILKKYNVPAIAFISAGLIDVSSEEANSIESYVTSSEIAEMSNNGIAIGSHSFSHRSLCAIEPAEAMREARNSKKILEDCTRKPVTAFAYPFGTRMDFNSTTEAVLRKCGYTSVFTSQHGAIKAGDNPYRLPRIKIESGESLGMFRIICGGGMDSWRFVDTLLCRLQQSGKK